MPKREMREGFGNQVLDRGEGFRIAPRPKPPRKCRNPKCPVVFEPQQPNHLYHRKECQVAHSNERKLEWEAKARKTRRVKG